MKTLLTLLLVFSINLLSFAQVENVEPRIISTIPEFGDFQVDPKLEEIIVEFDRDMASSMSVVSTKNFPTLTGKPKWINSRILSIPVKLSSNALYSLGFNNSKFRNFKSKEGVLLNPSLLTFHTQDRNTKGLNKKAYNELIKIFPKKYSYASLRGVNWEQLLEEQKKAFLKSETALEFSLQLVKILKEAEDPHLWVEFEGKKFETALPRLVEQNYNYKKVLPLLQNIIVSKTNKNGAVIGQLNDSLGYMLLRTWRHDFFNQTYMRMDKSVKSIYTAEEVIKDLFKYPNLIVDVRGNAGGNEAFAKKFASFFIDDTIPYELVKQFDGKSELFVKERIKKMFPNQTSKSYEGNIYILSGPSVMSSNESFLLMMKQCSNANIVGMQSYGSSGNPKRYELSNGTSIYIPSWQAYTLDGDLIEGNGIQPDINLITTYTDFKNGAILIRKIIELIKKEQYGEVEKIE